MEETQITGYTSYPFTVGTPVRWQSKMIALRSTLEASAFTRGSFTFHPFHLRKTEVHPAVRSWPGERLRQICVGAKATVSGESVGYCFDRLWKIPLKRSHGRKSEGTAALLE